jgi:hypothetical protein
MTKRTVFTFVILMLTAALAACQPTPGDTATAEQAVEQYLTAKVAGDREAMAQRLCSRLEAQLDQEALSFSAVEASIEGLTCTADPGSTTVTCSGEIVATYGLEQRSFPLGTYSVVEEDGVWRWCGETAVG